MYSVISSVPFGPNTSIGSGRLPKLWGGAEDQIGIADRVIHVTMRQKRHFDVRRVQGLDAVLVSGSGPSHHPGPKSTRYGVSRTTMAVAGPELSGFQPGTPVPSSTTCVIAEGLLSAAGDCAAGDGATDIASQNIRKTASGVSRRVTVDLLIYFGAGRGGSRPSWRIIPMSSRTA
jgi:hypothetical protein